jgi:hypothetical protein
MPLIQVHLTPGEDSIVYAVKAHKGLKDKASAIRHIIKEYEVQRK